MSNLNDTALEVLKVIMQMPDYFTVLDIKKIMKIANDGGNLSEAVNRAFRDREATDAELAKTLEGLGFKVETTRTYSRLP